MLHWSAGAQGCGVLCPGDIAAVAKSKASSPPGRADRQRGERAKLPQQGADPEETTYRTTLAVVSGEGLPG